MNEAIMINYNVVLRLLPSTSIYKMHEGVGGCEGPGVIRLQTSQGRSC